MRKRSRGGIFFVLLKDLPIDPERYIYIFADVKRMDKEKKSKHIQVCDFITVHFL